MKKILVAEDDRVLRLALSKLLTTSGFDVTESSDGLEAHAMVRKKRFDLMLLDLGLPGMSGMDILAKLRTRKTRPRVIVITADETPDTVLRAVREQAYSFVSKPIQPKAIVDAVRNALAGNNEPPKIEIVSARPDWVELLVPCDLETAERIQTFLLHLKADLREEVRESVGRAFRELLLNAMEWGGRLDPSRRVRISYLRARKMLLYRIADPGPGFKLENIHHAAVSNPRDDPFAHIRVREEKGLRPGGFGIMLVKAMVDELLYNEARNEVVFIKYLDGV